MPGRVLSGEDNLSPWDLYIHEKIKSQQINIQINLKPVCTVKD